MTRPIAMSATELAALMTADAAPLILDVLPSGHWERCHLPRAVNACVYEVGFLDAVARLAPDPATPMVLYGAGEPAQDAVMAAGKLERAGYMDVRVLAGGLAQWHADGRALDGAVGVPAPVTGPPALQEGHWRVDPGASWVRWVGRNGNGFHDGSVDVTDGSVTLTAGRAAGSVTVDPRTLRSHDLAGDPSHDVLIAHLLSDDFLFAERFPAVEFTVSGVRALADAVPTSATHEVSGELLLRGVRKPLTFPATVSERPGERLAVEAHFELDRTRWGVIYGSARFFRYLGMHAVFDPVSIALRLELVAGERP